MPCAGITLWVLELGPTRLAFVSSHRGWTGKTSIFSTVTDLSREKQHVIEILGAVEVAFNLEFKKKKKSGSSYRDRTGIHGLVPGRGKGGHIFHGALP